MINIFFKKIKCVEFSTSEQILSQIQGIKSISPLLKTNAILLDNNFGFGDYTIEMRQATLFYLHQYLFIKLVSFFLN